MVHTYLLNFTLESKQNLSLSLFLDNFMNIFKANVEYAVQKDEKFSTCLQLEILQCEFPDLDKVLSILPHNNNGNYYPNILPCHLLPTHEYDFVALFERFALQ